VFAIWESVLGGDSRDAIDGTIFDDPRVVSFWDPREVSGTWFGHHPLAGLGGDGTVVWDAYYAFEPSAGWRAAPSGAVAAGSDIIGSTDGLTRSFVPLLK